MIEKSWFNFALGVGLVKRKRERFLSHRIVFCYMFQIWCISSTFKKSIVSNAVFYWIVMNWSQWSVSRIVLPRMPCAINWFVLMKKAQCVAMMAISIPICAIFIKPLAWPVSNWPMLANVWLNHWRKLKKFVPRNATRRIRKLFVVLMEILTSKYLQCLGGF